MIEIVDMFGALNVQKFILPGFISFRTKARRSKCVLDCDPERPQTPPAHMIESEGSERGLIPTTTPRPENGKRNNFPQTSRGQSGANEKYLQLFTFLS